MSNHRTDADNLAAWFQATESDIQKTNRAMEIYLSTFQIDRSEFLKWISTDEKSLQAKMADGTFVNLRTLEEACFSFCSAVHAERRAAGR